MAAAKNIRTPRPAEEFTHGDLEQFLSSKTGRTMLSGRSLRRAFFATPQRVNEKLAGYAIDIHEVGLKGLAKRIGSLRVTKGELMVTRHLPDEGKTRKLNELANILGHRFNWRIKILPNI